MTMFILYKLPTVSYLLRLFVCALMLNHGFAETSSATPENVREWTNLDGKKISAVYLGHKDNDVALRLENGKIFFVPAVKLSTADNLHLKQHHQIYIPSWQTWSDASRNPIRSINVSEELGDAGVAYYTTQNFRFQCDVNLGQVLMKDVARVFELTHNLHKHSPLGILAKPEAKHFPARLIGRRADYIKQGGSSGSAGVYLVKERIFMAPLELMGMQPGAGGWKKVKDEYDPKTIIHELTHMLTHDVLNDLPIWLNEGYAEYISHIPLKGDSFRTDKKSIVEGIRDKFYDAHIQSTVRRGDNSLPKFSRVDRDKYLKSDSVPHLTKISKVLGMTNQEWATGVVPLRNADPSINEGVVRIFPPTIFGNTRLQNLYSTSHLILFYFLEIEGEEGVRKIRSFLEKNRTQTHAYEKYKEDFKKYEDEFAAFLQLPDVVKLPDNRIQYPSGLTPPTAPSPPDIDPYYTQVYGLDKLLDGESVETLGAKIENALIEELGINLKFH